MATAVRMWNLDYNLGSLQTLLCVFHVPRIIQPKTLIHTDLLVYAHSWALKSCLSTSLVTFLLSVQLISQFQ